MDSLTIGFFHDSTKRDHAFTLSGLEEAYRRSRSTSAIFRADASRPAAAPDASLFEDQLTVFDAIALEPEFAGDPALRESLFLFDSAVDLPSLPWREGEWDEIGRLDRVAALDIRAWSRFSEIFAREIPLLPAPLASHRGLPPAPGDRVALIVNDDALARRAVPELLRALQRVDPRLELLQLRNSFREPARQSAWLAPGITGASAHVHIGLPPDCISCGRLIDSMNLRAPCVVFGPAGEPIDAAAALVWRRPRFAAGDHFLRAETVPALVEAMVAVARDATVAQPLVRNALREVAVFHEEVQNSLLPGRFVETYLEGAP